MSVICKQTDLQKLTTRIVLPVLLPVLLAGLMSGCSDKPEPVESIDRLVAEMSQRVQASTRLEQRDGLIPRFNQPKTIACLRGEFTVADDVPQALRHGLFEQPASYPVTARFANASKWDDSKRDIRGLSLRVDGVRGDPVWGESGRQDFLLNSYPALFVATPEEFLGFMRARQAGLEGERFGLISFFLSPSDPHIGSLISVLRARQKHTSPVDIRYWSTVPFALDSRVSDANDLPTDVQAVKYSVSPCSEYTTDKAVEPGEHQLRAAIKAHLEQAPVCLAFAVQPQRDPKAMPIEDASVIWDEDQSPFVTVARLSFEQQVMDDAAALDACEKTQFNPWQSLPEHTPLGRMNAVRKAVYEAGAALRAGSSRSTGGERYE